MFSALFSGLFSAARFFWIATRGHRLTPWRSPYLRWRMETYTGKPAYSLVLSDFLKLGWQERRQVLHYFRWLGELDLLRRGKPGR